MKLTQKQLKQLIKEETEACWKEYGLCVKDIEDPDSDEALECVDELNDCEESQVMKDKFSAFKQQHQKDHVPSGLSGPMVKAGLKAYLKKWWKLPAQEDAKQKISRKFEFDPLDWHFNHKTKMYRFGAGGKNQLYDYRNFPGYKEAMASVWPAYEKCHEEAEGTLYSGGGYFETQSNYQMHMGWCEDNKLAPIKQWLDRLKEKAMAQHEKDNLDPEIPKYFERHSARKASIAARQKERAKFQKDAQGWDDAISSLDYMHEMNLTQKQLKQIIQEELDSFDYRDSCPELDERIGALLMSANKGSIIHGLHLYHTLNMHLFDIELHVHGGTPNAGIPDPRVHIEFSGPDSEKFMKCLSFEALLPQPNKTSQYLNRFKRMAKFKFSFIPNVGGRHSTWIKAIQSKMNNLQEAKHWLDWDETHKSPMNPLVHNPPEEVEEPQGYESGEPPEISDAQFKSIADMNKTILNNFEVDDLVRTLNKDFRKGLVWLRDIYVGFLPEQDKEKIYTALWNGLKKDQSGGYQKSLQKILKPESTRNHWMWYKEPKYFKRWIDTSQSFGKI